MSARLLPGCLLAGVALASACAAEAPPPAVPKPFVPSTITLTDVSREAGLTIVQETGSAGVDWILDSVGAGAAWLDYDGDGDPDLYLVQGATAESPAAGPPDVLLRNDGDADGDGVPRFTDVTQAAGLGDRRWSFGAAVADYDGDGDPDLYLTNWGANRLYRNDGDGSFTEIGARAGVADERWGVSAAWSDVDRDGDLDLYVANYLEFAFDRYPARGKPWPNGAPPCVWKGIEVFCGPRGLPAAHDALFRNDGDPDGDGVPAFTDVTQRAGLITEEPYYALAARFFDADDDGDPDLYVANDSTQNGFFVNRGDGTFVESAILAGLAYNEQGNEQAGMGIAVGDYDLDLRPDLAVSNFSQDHDTLYHNDGERMFRDVSFPAGIGTATFYKLSWGLSFADLDQDGLEDLFIAHGHVYPQVDEAEIGTAFRQPDSLFRNRGDGRFEDVTRSAGTAMAAAAASRAVLPVDLDGDGDLDLLITTLDGPPRLLRNDTAAGHWLQVRLAGAAGNRDGIGARVVAVTGDRRRLREVGTAASFAGSVLPLAHFGLAGARVVDRLEVRWPSGRISVLEQVEADRRVVVEEPAP